MTNLERLQEAYKSWHDSKGSDPSPWFDLMADSVDIQSLGNESKPLAFANRRRSKQEAAEYFSSLTEHWTMVHWTPETFVTEGNRIAVFARCAWTNKATGKTVETPSAHLWQFEGGKAASIVEIFDSARVMAAATP
ncbi:MAG: nuclear transport factor 2 family protein [Hyphomicrobiaceae bacterium]